MNDAEKTDLLSEMADLWPERPLNTAQQRVWFAELEKLDFDKTRAAMRYVCANQTINYRRVPMGKILERARAYGAAVACKTNAKDDGPVVAYTLQCLETGRKCRFFVGQRRNLPADPDTRLRIAQAHADEIGRAYGGTWIPVIERM